MQVFLSSAQLTNGLTEKKGKVAEHSDVYCQSMTEDRSKWLTPPRVVHQRVQRPGRSHAQLDEAA